MNDYFVSVLDGKPDREFEELFMSRVDLRRFYGMGMNWGKKYPDSQCGWAKYLATHDASAIGIDGVLPDWFAEKLPGFARYARWPVYDYGYNKGLTGYDHHAFFSSRMKCTRITAELFGMDCLVPETKYICLKTGGTVKTGIAAAPAQGVNPDIMKDMKITPSFQRAVSQLGLLDVICHHMDHRPNNYYCILNGNGEVTGLSVFDNDEAATFAPVYTLNFSNYGLEAPFVKDGRINRPYLDRENVSRVLEVQDRDISRALGGNLTRIELGALLCRIRKLRRVLRSSLKSGTLTLLSPEEWTPGTMQEELGGRYGMTHLKNFVRKYHPEIVP